MMLKKLNVFISSSQEELAYEREIVSEVIHGLSLHPILFEFYPSLNSSPTNAFLTEVQECDIFILLLSSEFRPAVEKEYQAAVATNKPILIFVKNNPLFPVTSELNQFISGFHQIISRENMRISTYRKYSTLNDLRIAVRESLTAEIGKFYKEPISTLSKEEMYNVGTSIIGTTQKRLCMFQRTPTLFLGTTDKLSSNPFEGGAFQIYEKSFLDALEEWIGKFKHANDVNLLYLFDIKSTAKALNIEGLSQGIKKEIFTMVVDKITFYKKMEKETNYRFKFTALNTPVSGPFLVGDNRYGIWIMGTHDALSFSQENEKVASTLIRMISSHTSKSISEKELIDILRRSINDTE
jgi:hypothetical protein